MIVHEAERLSLQSWELSDFERFAPIARDPVVMRFIGDGQPWPDSRIGWFMGLQRAYQHGLGYCCWKLIEKDSDALIGFCGLAPVFELDEVEIGWWLAPSHWGHGLAFEAASEVADAAFAEHGLERVVARVYAANDASVRLIERLGMTFVRDLAPTDVGPVMLFGLEKGGARG